MAYQIDAKYDPAQHTVDATETLTYRNLTGQPLDRFPFHLYLNAFQPKSTWVREAHRDGNFRTSSWRSGMPKDYGSNEVTSLEVVGMGDLTKQMKFISPDDGNPDDKTVFEVQLAAADSTRPGRAVQDQVPREISRSRCTHRIQAHVPARRTVVPEGRECGGMAHGTATSSTP